MKLWWPTMEWTVFCVWMRWWSLCDAFINCILLIVCGMYNVGRYGVRVGHYNEQQKFPITISKTPAIICFCGCHSCCCCCRYCEYRTRCVWSTNKLTHMTHTNVLYNKYIVNLLLLYKAINMIYCLFNYVIFMLCAMCV